MTLTLLKGLQTALETAEGKSSASTQARIRQGALLAVKAMCEEMGTYVCVFFLPSLPSPRSLHTFPPLFRFEISPHPSFLPPLPPPSLPPCRLRLLV
jgi:hypothetical protein